MLSLNRVSHRLLPLIVPISWSISNALPFRSDVRSLDTLDVIFSSDIVWNTCPGAIDTPRNVTCANFTVPLDWMVPAGDKITIGMARLATQSTDPSSKIGNLFANPGGPGRTGSGLVAQMALGNIPVGEEVLRSFNIIGVDPRGIGLSTLLECDDTIWNERVTLVPQSEAAFRQLVDRNERMGLSCREKSGRLIDFLDTTSVAHDIEAARQVLGGEPLNWLGLSYGSQIGTQYAEIYPGNIRTMVFDGVLRRDEESYDQLIESLTFERSLEHFFEWCASSTQCPLNGTYTSLVSSFDKLVAMADDSPLPAPGCDDKACRSTVWAEDVLFKTQSLLYDPRKHATLGQAIAEGLTGNATLFSPSLIPAFTADPLSAASSFLAFGSICQDWTHYTTTFEQFQTKVYAGLTMSPHTRGLSYTWKIQTQCLGWPAALSNPPRDIHVEGSAPKILMTNSFWDPSTSYVWAMALRDEIGDAVLVSRNGSGHTSYGLGGETHDVIEEYLLRGTLPLEGTVLQT